MDQALGPFGEIRAASTQTGAALTAAITGANAFVAFPTGSQYAYLEGRTFATAVVAQYALNPYLRVLKTTDNFAAAANATDYSEVAQNGMPVTGAVVLSSLATTGALWVGAALPFRGVFADVSAANGTANTAAATYYSATGPTMATLSITDGTANGGASVAQDGGITWTVPTDWIPGTLRSIVGAAVGVPYSGESLYWVKLQWNAAHDSATTLNQLLSMNRSTNYALLAPGRPGQWLALPTGSGRYGCIEAKVDGGTGFLLVNVATGGGGSKFP